MLIKIAIATLLIVGLALGGEMALTSAVVEELKRSGSIDAGQSGPVATSVTPLHAAIRCFNAKPNNPSAGRRACVA